VSFLTSASSTRRTEFRSTDQRCKEAPVVFEGNGVFGLCQVKKATAPFSNPTAPAAWLRKSCTVRIKACGVTDDTRYCPFSCPASTVQLPSSSPCGPAPPRQPSVTCDHCHAVAVDVPAPLLIRMWDNGDIRSTESGSSTAASKSCG
jgi:hypothetical protein